MDLTVYRSTQRSAALYHCAGQVSSRGPVWVSCYVPLSALWDWVCSRLAKQLSRGIRVPPP